MTDRLIKLNALLRDELARAINKEVDLEYGVIVTVTQVDVSPTLENANVKISAYPENTVKKVFAILNEKIYAIQQVLNSRLKMHPVPKIRFEIDQSEQKADKIEDLLQKIN